MADSTERTLRIGRMKTALKRKQNKLERATNPTERQDLQAEIEGLTRDIHDTQAMYDARPLLPTTREKFRQSYFEEKDRQRRAKGKPTAKGVAGKFSREVGRNERRVAREHWGSLEPDADSGWAGGADETFDQMYGDIFGADRKGASWTDDDELKHRTTVCIKF